MSLCVFVQTDEDALICDFAETYHIYDWRSLPGRYAATLAAGLRQDSRIRMKVSHVKANLDSSLLAMIHDDLTSLIYVTVKSRSKKHFAKPDLIANRIIHGDTKKQADEYQGYTSAEDFEKAWERLSGNKHMEGN